MNAAVAQLAVVEIGFLRTFTGEFGHSRHCLALALVLLNLLKHHLRDLGILVKIIVNLGLYEVSHILVDTYTAVGHHRERTKLNLGLALEHRLLHIDGYGSHNAVANVAILEVLVIELLDGLGDMLLEGTLMSTALGGMLTVDKRVILLAILVGMGEGNLDVLALEVDDRIETVTRHRVVEKIFESVAAQDAPSVIHDGKPRVEIGIVAEHGLDDVVVEGVVEKQRVIWLEVDICAVFVVGGLGGVGLQYTFLECCGAHLTVSERAYFEVRTERIDRFYAHSVESDALFERL